MSLMSAFPRWWAAAALAVAVGAACGGSDDSGGPAATPEPSREAPVRTVAHATPPDQTLEFVAQEYSFEGPTVADAGMTEMVLTNEGAEEHQLALFRMNEGVDAGTVLGALGAAGHLEAARELGTWIAGPNLASANATESVVIDLEPGRYIVGCVIPAPDGQPHAMKGMLSELTVAEAPVAHHIADDTLPTVGLEEFGFELPDGFDGRGSVEVVNNGGMIHEFGIVRLNDGATVDDVIAYERQPFPRTGDAPAQPATGTTFLDPGGRARLDLDLPPGRYAAVCYLPLPESHDAHLEHGMIEAFTVS